MTVINRVTARLTTKLVELRGMLLDVLCGLNAVFVALILSAAPVPLLDALDPTLEGAPDTLNPGTLVDPTEGGKPVPVAAKVVPKPTLMPKELPPYQMTVLPCVIVVGLDCHG